MENEKPEFILKLRLMSKKILFALLVIFVFAYFLRVLFLPQLALTFGYDQARDAYVTQQIIGGDLKILGPPASTPGLYHGVFYYYFLTPGYLLGKGSPIIAAWWVALANALTVFIVFYLVWLLTKKTGAAVLASFLFAISFEGTQYATWVSNPTIGIWTVPLAYLGLWAALSGGKKWGPVLAGVGLGLSVQANIFLAYHIPPFVLWLAVARERITKQSLILLTAAFLAAISPMLVSELKFGFKSIGGVAVLLLGQDPIVLSKGLGDFIVLYLNQLGRTFAYSAYPGNIGYGGVFILLLLVLSLLSWRQSRPISWQPFLATWILSHLTVVSVGGTSTPFLLVGIGPAVSMLAGISLYSWWVSGKRILVGVVLAIIIFGNINMILKENHKGQTIFAIQKDMVLAKQLPAIDYTYQEAAGKPFSINSLTSPLWINIVWTYLYKWYGLPKYGYIPEWHGKDQVGQLDGLPPEKPDTKLHFLILEPMGGIPARYLPEAVAEEDAVSEMVDEKYFGELGVQKRIRKQDGV